MDLKKQCSAVIEHFKQEIKKLRSGRITADSLDYVKVDVHGSLRPLKGCGAISCDDRRLIIVPFDPDLVHAIRKSIEMATEFCQVSVERNQIVVHFSPPSKETRLETLKLANKKSEEARVSVRQHRKEALDELKKKKNSKEITEDEFKRSEKRIQEQVDAVMKEIDLQLQAKEKELNEFS